MTDVICPAISISATKSRYKPVSISLWTMTTRLLYCRPTAASVPFLLIENCRGNDPPAGKSCSSVNFPESPSILHVWRLSDGNFVLFLGSKLRISKRESFRDDVRTNLWSGLIELLAYATLAINFEHDRGRLTVNTTSAAVTLGGIGCFPSMPVTNTSLKLREFRP